MLRRKLVRGFTIPELIAILVVVIIAIVLILPFLGSHPPGSGRGVRRLKDSAQVRGITQAMAIWAGSHKSHYPLPSEIDLENTTVADQGPAKATTANILSLMVFNGSVPTEILISPAEANSNIQQCTTYQYNTPTSAIVPARALWDPVLSADFTGQSIAHNSYAHLLPSGPRLANWTDQFKAITPVFGNRGPQIASVVKNTDGTVKATVVNPKSNTFLIHGSPKTWEGNIGYSDAHVDFATNLSPQVTAGLTYRDATGAVWPDLLHYDEPDDPTGTNTFLGIFTKAGPKPADFTAIWD